jgi:hypothetical protein
MPQIDTDSYKRVGTYATRRHRFLQENGGKMLQMDTDAYQRLWKYATDRHRLLKENGETSYR